MRVKKPMTEAVRQKIRTYIKNGLDISDLIADYSIKGENLTGAIIKKLNRAYDDMSGVNMTKTIVGEKGKTNNITRAKLKKSIWCDAEIRGYMIANKCDCRDADFSGAQLSNVEYQFCDFRGAKFCETLMRIGSAHGMGAKFDTRFFRDLAKGWSVTVVPNKEYKNETRTIS
jgi:uncharacterized protein YjbI with pentapeptide repeats